MVHKQISYDIYLNKFAWYLLAVDIMRKYNTFL